MHGKIVKEMDLRARWEINGQVLENGKIRCAAQKGPRFLPCITVPFADIETPRTGPSLGEEAEFCFEKLSL